LVVFGAVTFGATMVFGAGAFVVTGAGGKAEGGAIDVDVGVDSGVGAELVATGRGLVLVAMLGAEDD
jgi:hypothetical protein